MKVIHLVIGGDSGGAKTHILTLLNQLKHLIDIELICLSQGVLYEDAKKLGIHTTLTQQKNRMDLSIIKTLASKIKDQKVDIVHCHGARANFVSTFLKSKINIPIITTIHSDYKQDFAHSFIKQLIFSNLNRYSLNKMDYYLSVTNVFKAMLGEQGFDLSKIHTIYNGIQVHDYPEQSLHHPLTFSCVTRFVPIKGTHILLEAVNHCVKKGYEPKVLIAGTGSGPYVTELHNYVKDNKLSSYVTFKGYVKDIDAFYQEVDVNILPSLTESFPYALLEGGIRHKGSIASKAGGIVEMIEDGKTGRLFPSGNAKALAAVMIEFMKQPENAHKYGHSFSQKIKSSFSDKAMAKRHVEIYESIISSRTSTSS